MKTFLLTLVAVIVAALDASYAGDDFRVTIVKGDSEPKLTAEQIGQFKKAGITSPNDLPIIVCPSGANPKAGGNPADTFQVVIENLHDSALSVTMKDSDWYYAVTFKLVDDKGTVYTITHGVSEWQKNSPETWTWDAHGTRKVAISFVARYGAFRAWVSYVGEPSHPRGLPSPATLVLARLTAVFTYPDQNHKSVTVTSKPTDVILISQ